MMAGLGDMGLNPWELYRYTMEEFVWKMKGHRKNKMEQWQHTRALAFVIAKPHLKSQNMRIEKFWPLETDMKETVRLADIKDPAEKRKKAEELYKWYVDNGHIKSN